MQIDNKIIPNLWFDTQAEEAAEYYVSLFPDAKIINVMKYPDEIPAGSPEGMDERAGTVLTVDFQLAGQTFVAINGGPEFQFTEAISLMISCDSQEEVDHYWNAFSQGGTPGPCGWIKDRFGLSWQVTPKGMNEMLNDADREKANRAFAAMMQMGKLDIADLQKAFEGEGER